MIDIRKLKELVKLMVENELSELDLRDQSETVTIKRGGDQEPIIYQAPAAAAPAAAPAAVAAEPAPDAPNAADAGLIPIESPMVGTYYSRPNPESPIFANVGDSVGPDTVICLLEAMKVFNEIKAEQSGTIAKVLVKDGDSVEFGQPLFMIKPN